VGAEASRNRRLEQAHVVLLLPAGGARDPDYFAQRLFAEMLGGGMSSRLFQEAREARGLAYAIDAWSESYSEGGLFGIYAGCAAGDAAELAQVCAHELLALSQSVHDAELSRAKAQLKASLFMGREQPQARAEQAAGQALLFERLFSPAELAEAIDTVGPADIARVGSRLLAGGRTAGAVLGSKAALGAVAAFGEALKAG